MTSSSTRYARKGFSPDLLGIHWEKKGEGQRHEAGRPWGDDEWEQFKAWALEQGAKEDSEGVMVWEVNNKYHREDGPAVIGKDGETVWVSSNNCHREVGPAFVHSDGTQSWWLYDRLHRKDGPAVINADGSQFWWLKGIRYTDETFSTPFS